MSICFHMAIPHQHSLQGLSDSENMEMMPATDRRCLDESAQRDSWFLSPWQLSITDTPPRPYLLATTLAPPMLVWDVVNVDGNPMSGTPDQPSPKSVAAPGPEEMNYFSRRAMY